MDGLTGALAKGHDISDGNIVRAHLQPLDLPDVMGKAALGVESAVEVRRQAR